MLTITDQFLAACPKWKKAGWRTGDVVNICTLDDETLQVLSLHPPKKPGTPKQQ